MPSQHAALSGSSRRILGRLAGLALAVLLVATGQPAVAAPAEESNERSDYLVAFAPGTTAQERDDALAAAGALVTSTVPPLRLYATSLTDGGVQTLRDIVGVDRVERDLVRELQAEPSDPGYADQWSLPAIAWDEARSNVLPAGSAVVAVLDTGVSPTEDLGDALVPGASMLGDDSTADPNGHGTEMASIVAAGVDNGVGIAGVGYAGVSVMPVKVLDAGGLGQDSAVVEGVVYAADHGADVILMSFSNPGASAALQAAVDYAWSRGVILVAATGNDGATTPTYPAGTAKVVGVSATDRDDSLWSGSNSGAATFLAAPGVDIATGVGASTGTSASAAIVAGAAALLKAADATASNGVIIGRLARNADPVGSASDTGNGRVNLARALADTSDEAVVPQGVAGDGGPLVGPYVAADKGLDLTFAGTGSGSIAFSNLVPARSVPSCTTSCSPQLDNDQTGTLTVTPSAGSTFTGWSGSFGSGGTTTCTGTTSPCTFSMSNAAQTLTATFAAAPTGPSATTTTLTRTDGTTPSTYGSSLTFSAVVTGPPSPGNVGTVTFKSGATTICSAVPISAGTATCSPARLPVGTHSLTAEYSGGTGFAASISNALPQVVSAKALTGSFTAGNKTYDGDTSASVLTRSLSGVVATDTVSLTGGTATFDNKLVGTGKTVALSGAALSGADAGNYTLGSVSTTTANITTRALTITAADQSKVFGELKSLGTSLFTLGAGQLVSGDSVSAVTLTSAGSAASASVGGYPIVASGASGAGLGNYAISYRDGTLTVTPKSQQITFVQPTDKVFGSTFSVSPTSNSGLPVTVQAAGGCSAQPHSDPGSTGFLVTITSGSTDCVLTASQAGNSNVAAAAEVVRTVTVHKVPLTVTTDAHPATAEQERFTKVYGSANPAFSAAYSGFVLGQGPGSLGGTLQFATSATQGSAVGAYSVTPHGLTSADYDLTFVAGGLDITKAPLTVTVDSDPTTPAGDAFTKVFGAALPTFSVRYSGFVLDDGPDALGGALEFVTSATAGSAVGTYAVSAQGRSSSNYDITYVEGSLVITQAGQTITFADPGDKVFGDAFTVSPTSDSSLHVVVQATGGCTAVPGSDPDIAGFLVRITSGSATCVLTASQDGNSNYSPAAEVVRTVMVSKKLLTVTARDASKQYGDANPALEFDYSADFVGGDGAGDINTAPTCSTAAENSSPVGSYAVTCAGAVDGNYRFTYVAGSLSVTAKALTVTVDADPDTEAKDAFAKVYGSANPAFGVRYDGFVLGEDAEVLDGDLDFETAADSASDVGSYPVSVDGLSSDNYAISYVAGSLSVTAKALTVTVDADPDTAVKDAFTKVYGSANPAFTVRYEGFVPGHGPGSLTGTPAYTTAATASSDVGSYPVSVDGLSSDNYAISYVAGSLSVTAKALTITVDADPATEAKDAFTKVYGSDNPAFSVRYDGFVLSQGPGSLTGAPAYTTAATAASNVGSYPVSVDGLSSGNYAISYVAGSLSVTAKALTITVDATPSSAAQDEFTKVYGSDNPAFSVRYDGFVLGQGPGSLTGAPAYTTAATAASNVGSYPVSVDGLSSDNYAISYVAGSLSVTAKALTITVDATPSSAAQDEFTKVYGSDNPAFSVRYDGFVLGQGPGSLTGAPAYTTAATAASDVGSYPVSVDGLSSDNYAISYVAGSLSVTRQALTITVDATPSSAAQDAFTKVYGSANPAFSVRYDGFVLGQDAEVLDGDLDFETAATAASHVGSYPVSVDGLSSDNYAITYVAGSLSVTAKALTITVDANPATDAKDAFTKVYGSDNPAFSVRYDGFVLGQGPGSLTGAPAYTTAATAASDVGSYPVSVDGLSSANYAISYVAGSLSVTRQPLTITVDADPATEAKDAFTKVYGSANPAFAVHYDGFVLGEDAEVLDGDLDFETAATAASNVGSYPVSVDGLSSDNYAITYVAGSLSVTAKALTVTVDATPSSAAQDEFTKVYGSDNPAFSVRYDGFVLGEGAEVLDGDLDFETAATAASNVGSYPVSVDGLSSDNYAITYVAGSLSVTAKALTITVDATPSSAAQDEFTKVYGSDNPAFAVRYDGFVLGEDAEVLDGDLDFETAADSASNIGSYPVSVDGLSSGNYAISYVAGSLSVTAKALTVTVDATPSSAAQDEFTKVYGSDNPAFSVRYDGFVLGQGPGSLTGAPAYTTAATAASNVGSYPVSVDGLSSGNYAISYVAGSLSVTRQPLTITVDADPATDAKDAFTKVYGSANPAFSVRYDGFVLGQGPGSLTGAPAYTTAATAASNVGSYPVTVDGLSSANYAITYVAGSLSILYRWDGYLQPINDTAHMVGVSESKFKFGQTIPVKFTVKKADGTVVQQVGANPTFSYGYLSATCDFTVTSESVPADTPTSGPVFDWDGSKYQYNWSTKGLTKQGEYRIFANLADGTRRHVDVCLSK